MITTNGVVEEVGEVGKEVQLVGAEPGVEAGGAVPFLALQSGGEAVAGGVSAGGGIDRSETINGGDGAGGFLVGGIPVAKVGERGDVPVVFVISFAVSGEEIVAIVVVSALPRTVFVSVFQAEREVAASDGPGVGQNNAGLVIFTISGREESAGKDVEEPVISAAGCRKFAEGGFDGAFEIINVLNEFGDNKIEIGVALTVTVGAVVCGHAIDSDVKIGAVIKVEAPNEILVGLAAAGVLGRDETGDDFEELSTSQGGALTEFFMTGLAGGGGSRFAKDVFCFADHFDFGQDFGVFKGILCGSQEREASQDEYQS